jgi:hypothetical protein
MYSLKLRRFWLTIILVYRMCSLHNRIEWVVCIAEALLADDITGMHTRIYAYAYSLSLSLSLSLTHTHTRGEKNSRRGGEEERERARAHARAGE